MLETFPFAPPLSCGHNNGDSFLNNRDGLQAKSVFSGWNYSIVLTEMGQLVSFGWGMYGQVSSSSISPVWCLRSSHDRMDGQLGQGDLTNEFLPRPIDFTPASETGDGGAGDYDDDEDDEDIVDCACGLWHAVAITESGKVYAWGYGKDGQVRASAYQRCVQRNQYHVSLLDGPWEQ